MNIKVLLLSIVSILLLSGCSYKYTERTTTITKVKDEYKSLPFPSASLEKTIQDNNTSEVAQINLNDKLNSFYRDWKGVKYKFGGNSKKGIDCSALIQKAFKQSVDMKLPRTTKLQAKLGKQINKSQLELGDLVFFKTGKNSRHVGIYMQNGKFMHASTKKGVIISKLSNVYFNKHYWKAQRVIY